MLSFKVTYICYQRSWELAENGREMGIVINRLVLSLQFDLNFEWKLLFGFCKVLMKLCWSFGKVLVTLWKSFSGALVKLWKSLNCFKNFKTFNRKHCQTNTKFILLWFQIPVSNPERALKAQKLGAWMK